jgi:RNA-directed DNA polymerase
MGELIKTINPIIRGWGNYYCRSQVRKRFAQLDRWIIRRLWSHRSRRWRNSGWKEYPTKRLRKEFFSSDRASPVMKAGCGKTARPV